MLPKLCNILLTLCMLFTTATVASTTVIPETVIVLNTTGQPPLNDDQLQGFMDQVAMEAFRRLGITLQTVQLPAERGLINANNGIDDGEMSRIAGLSTIYPNLIQVPEAIMAWEFVAIGNKTLKLNSNWQGLVGKAVAIINGWKILEANIPTQVALVKVKNPEQLFSILQRNRTDLIIYERWGGAMYIKQFALNEMEIKSPPLAVRDMYIYLHKKHQHLVERLAATLRTMKADGTYQKIKTQTLDKILLTP